MFFFEANPLSPAEVDRVTTIIQRSSLRYFHRHRLLEAHAAQDMLTWQGHGGFSVDASVRIKGGDQPGLERLLRYMARRPLSKERLESATDDGPGRPTPEGATVLRLSPLALLERLARLVPPPHRHRHRYHGVFAPSSPLRAMAVHPASRDNRVTIASSPLTPRPWSPILHRHSRRETFGVTSPDGDATPSSGH